MLGLQVDAPFHRILEFLARFLQEFHRFGVSHSAKVGVDDVVQPRKQRLIHERVEELHFFRCFFEYKIDDIFDHIFCDIQIIFQFRERHLRFDHPEFGRMAGGIGVFRAERRSECVNIAECQREDLCFQLSGYRQVGLLAEEVLAVIDLAVFCTRQVVEIQRRYLEHFTGALRVAGCDLRRMHVHKVLILEKLMDRVSDQRAHTEHRAEHIGPRTQIADLPEKFHRVALRLQRIIRCGSALYAHLFRFDLKRLLGVRRQDHFARNGQRGTDIGLRDLFVIREERFFVYDLYGLKERTVVQFDKAEFVGVSVVSDPAFDQDFLSRVSFGVSE